MEPKFSGPAYTVGIEEELMILDPDTYALVNAIDELLEDSPEGDIKPELMESVLEISTKPCADLREAGASLRALRRGCGSARRARTRPRCGRTSASPRSPATGT
jgi:glutamate---cysteine ligase / carboxylate-amine ligase